MKNIIVIYHGNCPDGFMAAWACWKKFGDNAEYFPGIYGNKPPKVQGKFVYIVDFSYTKEIMLEMQAEADGIKVFDHHKSAEKNLEGLPFTVFDMERSGCGITWDELHDEPRPWFLDYVEDRDLWRFALPDSKEINAYLDTIPKEFITWDGLTKMNLDTVVALGQVAWDMKMSYVDAAKKNAMPFTLHGKDTLIVNAPQWGISELLGTLAEENPQMPFVMGFSLRNDGVFQYSLRSRDGGDDVSEIAEKFGGGGHAGAAGFQSDKLPEDLGDL